MTEEGATPQDQRAMREDQPDQTGIREPDSDPGGYQEVTSYQAQPAPAAAPTRQQEMEGGMEAGPGPAVNRQAGAPTQTLDRQGSTSSTGLIHDQKLDYFAGRWDSIQAGFVDDPRKTVEQADRLVGEVIDHLSELFRNERAALESQWSKSGRVETEDLRVSIQRYRDFFRTLIGR